jgi:hypothetical protein
MAVPYVKQTWTDGSGGATPVSAARLGVLEQGVYDAHRMPTARVYASASVAVATATLTAIPFDSERYDTDTIHDTVTNNTRLTCKTAGVYVAGGTFLFPADANGYRDAQLVVNGSTIIGRQVSPVSSGTAQTIFTLAGVQWQFAVNDYVELKVAQTSGSTLAAFHPSGTGGPEFWMSRVST